jgi:hypothetical protein
MLPLSWLNLPPHPITVYASHPPSPTTTQHSLPGGALPPYRSRSFTGRTASASPDAPEPMVRIRLPPANSPSLAGFLLPISKSRQLPRGAPARPGGTAGRDAPGSSTSRQLPVISLSGPIPVPQCRLGGSRPWLHWCAKRGRVSDQALSSVQLRQSQARSAARASQVPDASTPAACLRSDRAADGRRGWLR